MSEEGEQQINGNGSQETGATLGLHIEDLTDATFSQICKLLGMSLKSWCLAKVDINQSVHHDLVQQGRKNIIGFRAFELTGNCENNSEERKVTVVLKSKVNGRNSMVQFNQLANMISPKVGSMYKDFNKHGSIGWSTIHLLEVRVAMRSTTDPSLGCISPRVYYCHIDEEKEQYYFINEHLNAKDFSHINAFEGGSGTDVWDDESMKKVLHDIAAFHASYVERTGEMEKELGMCLDHYPGHRDHACLYKTIMEECDILKYLGPARTALTMKVAENLPHIYNLLESSKRTMTHNDFNTRNMCLRRNPKNGQAHLCVYDWEAFSVDVPQRDPVEFIAFTLPKGSKAEAWNHYIEYYREQLRHFLARRSEALAEEVTEREHFCRIFGLSAMEYSVQRLAVVYMLLNVMELPFVQDVIDNLYVYLESIADQHAFLQ